MILFSQHIARFSIVLLVYLIYKRDAIDLDEISRSRIWNYCVFDWWSLQRWRFVIIRRCCRYTWFVNLNFSHNSHGFFFIRFYFWWFFFFQLSMILGTTICCSRLVTWIVKRKKPFPFCQLGRVLFENLPSERGGLVRVTGKNAGSKKD